MWSLRWILSSTAFWHPCGGGLKLSQLCGMGTFRRLLAERHWAPLSHLPALACLGCRLVSSLLDFRRFSRKDMILAFSRSFEKPLFHDFHVASEESTDAGIIWIYDFTSYQSNGWHTLCPACCSRWSKTRNLAELVWTKISVFLRISANASSWKQMLPAWWLCRKMCLQSFKD